MRKEVSPKVAVAVVIAAFLLIGGFLYYRNSRPTVVENKQAQANGALMTETMNKPSGSIDPQKMQERMNGASTK